MRSLLLLALAFSLLGCHRRHRERPPRQDAVPGLPSVPLQARQTTYSYMGGSAEDVPYGVPHDAVLDEATLYTQPNQVCANVLLRQPVGFDEPLSQYNMRCSADSRYKERTYPQQEQPASERDYPFQGPPPMFRVNGPHGSVSFPIGQARVNEFRVLERSFQVCCPFPAREVFRLTLETFSRYGESMRVDFSWRLQPQ